jgi:hypothetical protein
MTRTRTAVLLLLVCIVSVSSTGFAAGDRKIGKWKLRIDPPARGTREYQDRGDGLTVSIRQGVNARGQEYYSAYAAKVDGKEYPRAVRGSNLINTIAFTRVDEDTVAYTLREDGKVVATGTTAVSKDGRVLTVTTKNVNSTGPGNAEIYDRVE